MLPAVATPASAQDIGAAFGQAEALLAGDDPAVVWPAFDRAVELFWAEAPLAFRTVVLAETVEGYGRYQPRADNRFGAGDRLTVYVEPVGYGWTAIGAEYRIRFAIGMEISSQQRGTLVAEPDFATVERLARNRGREFEATVAFTVPALPPDLYLLALTFRDAATGKTATAAIDFEIVE